MPVFTKRIWGDALAGVHCEVYNLYMQINSWWEGGQGPSSGDTDSRIIVSLVGPDGEQGPGSGDTDSCILESQAGPAECECESG